MSLTFGEYLQQLREAKGYTAGRLAKEIGVDRSYISKVENDHTPVGIKAIRKMCQALDCSFIGMMIKAGHITEAEALGWIREQQAKSHPSD